jgi:single-stranded-DNA-specific exonuclease
MRCLETDGPLAPEHRRADVVALLQQEVWGQGFAPPTFCDTLDVVGQRIVGERHLSLRLRHAGQAVDGIWFGRTDPLPAQAKLAYRLDMDEWQGSRRVRFVIEGEASEA